MTSRSIWITWEDHRRSRELAKVLEADYFVFHKSGNRYVRYFILGVKTIFFLFKIRANIVYCQNPSIVLAAIVCFLKPILRYKIVVDRHSNFKFQFLDSRNVKWKIFHFLSRYTLRRADLTIITNDYLKHYVGRQGGRGFVLPDKLPTLSAARIQQLKGEFNFVFISTFSDDEPIEQVIEAIGNVDTKYHLYVTGHYSSYSNIDALVKKIPANVTLTGFLSEPDYQSLLASADTLIVITDQEYTLTCGAYEAVALEKPMILGDTETLKNYFSMGAVYTGIDANELSDKIRKSVLLQEKHQHEVRRLKEILRADWDKRFAALNELLCS